MKQIFVGAVDRLTEKHLQFLKLLQDPEAVRRKFADPDMRLPWSLSTVLDSVYEPLVGPRNIKELIWADLQAIGFCSVSEPGVVKSADAPKRITELGLQFLAFIEDPLDR